MSVLDTYTAQPMSGIVSRKCVSLGRQHQYLSSGTRPTIVFGLKAVNWNAFIMLCIHADKTERDAKMAFQETFSWIFIMMSKYIK